MEILAIWKKYKDYTFNRNSFSWKRVQLNRWTIEMYIDNWNNEPGGSYHLACKWSSAKNDASRRMTWINRSSDNIRCKIEYHTDACNQGYHHVHHAMLVAASRRRIQNFSFFEKILYVFWPPKTGAKASLDPPLAWFFICRINADSFWHIFFSFVQYRFLANLFSHFFFSRFFSRDVATIATTSGNADHHHHYYYHYHIMCRLY